MEKIEKVLFAMRLFQKKNNIKRECMTNAQYLYDVINQNTTIKVKVKCVLAVATDDDKNITRVIIGHLVLVTEDRTIIDPSYEVYSLDNLIYFDNIKDFMDVVPSAKSNAESCKTNFKAYLNLINIADKMNNGEFMISNKDFYNKQADFVEYILE